MLEDKKGEMFFPLEKGRVDIKKKTHMLNQKYNALTEYQPEARKEILKQILGELNENVVLQGPITFHYGVHTKIGKNTFINFNFIWDRILESFRCLILCFPASAKRFYAPTALREGYATPNP